MCINGDELELEDIFFFFFLFSIMFQMNPELEQDDYRSFLHQMSSPIANSPPGNWTF